jgi:hypothetical protein
MRVVFLLFYYNGSAPWAQYAKIKKSPPLFYSELHHMLKNILRLVLFISVILALGQIRVSKKSIGDHYVQGLRDAGRWSLDKAKNSKVMAGVTGGEWVEDIKEKAKSSLPKNFTLPALPSFKSEGRQEAEEPTEEVGAADQERVRRILE